MTSARESATVRGPAVPTGPAAGGRAGPLDAGQTAPPHSVGPPGPARAAELDIERIAWLRVVIAMVTCAATVIVANGSAVTDERFHWWANFVLVPGAVLTAVGFALRRRNAIRFTVGWLGSIVLTTGLLLLLGIMSRGWPMMIIMPCLGALALYTVRPAEPSVRALVDTVAGLGALAVVLGGTFLSFNLGAIHETGYRWWVWFMVAAGTVPALNGAVLVGRRRSPYWFSAAVLLIALGGFTILAAMREYGR